MEKLIKELEENGWVRFKFISIHSGDKFRSLMTGHEMGGDWVSWYLFDPQIDLTIWKNIEFSHKKERTQCKNSDKWDNWLENLSKKKYLKIT